MKMKSIASIAKQAKKQPKRAALVTPLPPGVRPIVAAAFAKTLKKRDALFRALAKSGD